MDVPVLGISEEPWSSVPGCFTWRVPWSCFLHFLSFPMLLSVVFPSRPPLCPCPGSHLSLTKCLGVLAAPGRSRPRGGGPGVTLAPGPRGGRRLSCLGELGRPCSGQGAGGSLPCYTAEHVGRAKALILFIFCLFREFGE